MTKVKRILLIFLGLLVVIGVLAGIKVLQIQKMIAVGKQTKQPPVVVTVAKVRREVWQRRLKTVGSLTAVQGVTVAPDLPGKIVEIIFSSGQEVRQGDLLLRLDTSTEQARLRAAETAVTLAGINRRRAKELVRKKSMSKAELDKTDAQYLEAVAKVDEIKAIIDKKNLKAPFSGRLGIRRVNLGQVLAQGDAIVVLQQLDPVYVDFSLPQQNFADLAVGMSVQVRTDALPGKIFNGKITAVNPGVDAINRNIKVRATLANPDTVLRPGMFVRVAVILPEKKDVLVLPATAILYAPYGDSVYVVEEKGPEKKKGVTKKSSLVLRQQVVRTGMTRGDFITVTSGLNAGQTVVTTGVFKFHNGQAVVIDNSLAPPFSQHPDVKNE
ncbi:MAG TPA: efflux RND transporter periplasmic adaptor subunit [Desulfobulbaceae bacterium]|nr:efflux RND transporter periplasmic adaptor subunit [Desulfobulbaceae bacterium]